MVIKYEEVYKNYNPPLPKDSKYEKGFSFAKSRIKDSLESEVKKHDEEKLDKAVN